MQFYNIVFCIFGCDTIDRYRKEILKIKETWGKAPSAPSAPSTPPNKILFFLGEEGPLQDDDCVHLENVENDYLSASYKQYGGLKYIYENYNFNYVFICGTDTYVLMNNLIDYINEDPQISPDKPLVIGGHGDNRQICNETVHFFSGGPGFILTKATMDKIYPELGYFQEEWMWICFENGYNTYSAACDLSLCYFLKRYGIIFVNVVNRFFNCNYLGYYPDNSECCAKMVDIKTMISCHHMSLENFDELEEIKKKG
jgi:hypothetical protein